MSSKRNQSKNKKKSPRNGKKRNSYNGKSHREKLMEEIEEIIIPNDYKSKFDEDEELFSSGTAMMDNGWEMDKEESLINADKEFEKRGMKKKEKMKTGIAPLSELGKKYAGKRTSRKQFNQLESSSDEENQNIDEDDSDYDYNDVEKLFMKRQQDNLENEYKEEEEEEESDDDSDSYDDSSDDDDDFGSNIYNKAFELESQLNQINSKSSEKKRKIQIMNDTKNELEKANNVVNQNNIWETMLGFRIKQQKTLNIANQIPEYDMMELFVKKDKEIKKTQKGLSNEICNLLTDLTELSETLKENNQEFDNFVIDNNKKKKSYKLLSKKRKIREWEDSDDYCGFWWNVLDSQNEIFEEYQNQIIEKWNSKTQLSSRISMTKFKSINQSVSLQVEHIMKNKDKLVNRTQIRRSNNKVFGRPPKKIQKLNNDEDLKENDKEDSKKNKRDIMILRKFEAQPPKLISNTSDEDSFKGETNTEIFDDTDFYQELLRQLIESKTNPEEENDLKLTRKFLQEKKNKSKNRIIDTKASKGRKLRYTIHEKLVNFMVPQEKELPHYVDGLFANLFKD